MRLLDEDESMNPALSMVNLVDVFLVLIAALLITIAQNPLNPFTEQNVTVIKNAGQPNMTMVIKDGKSIKSYQSKGEIGAGDGVKAGVAYRMTDGSIVYVPQSTEPDGTDNNSRNTSDQP